MARNNYDLTYVARDVSDKLVLGNYRIERIKSGPFRRRIGKVLEGGPLLSILSRIKPHIIYQRVGCAYTGIAAYYAKRSGCKMVWHISSDVNVLPFKYDQNISRNVIIRFIEKKMLEYGIWNCESIIAQTRRQAELLHKYYGRLPTRIVPNFQRPHAGRIEKRYPIKIIWIANFKPMKQPEIFIRLARDVSDKSTAKFIMVGSTGNTKWHQELLSDIEAAGCIEYFGAQSQENVHELLAQSHILVNTSLYEGFSNTFIEAWVREVPVVSLEIDPDNILENNGIGYCARSYENLLQKISMLIRNDELRQEMGKKAKQYALENHSLSNINKIIKEFDR